MMPAMRSTVRIDDDLMTAIKEEAERRHISVTRALNRALRAGMQVFKVSDQLVDGRIGQLEARRGHVLQDVLAKIDGHG